MTHQQSTAASMVAEETGFGQQYVTWLRENGIPAPWQEFGTLLTRDAAISNSIVIEYERAVVASNGNVEGQRVKIDELLQNKIENLTHARDILRQAMSEYDARGIWAILDPLTPRLLDDASLVQTLKPLFGLHPFPVVLESLKFNWEYMRQNGVRAFYEMTEDYLTKLISENEAALKIFREEDKFTIHPPFWLFRLDLLSVECPTHCDVCRGSITPLLFLAKMA